MDFNISYVLCDINGISLIQDNECPVTFYQESERNMKPNTMANRRGQPRMQRRYSLPATPTVMESPPHIPEGSDTFKKALQELTATEPHHAPNKSETRGLFGLNNIQEGDENDYTDSDDVTSPTPMTQPTYSVDFPGKVQRSRRYSSPSCLTNSEDRPSGRNSEKDNVIPDGKSKQIMQTLNQQRKEYFMKHGHFPIAGNAKPVQRPSSTQEKVRKTDIAFGSTLSSKFSKIQI